MLLLGLVLTKLVNVSLCDLSRQRAEATFRRLVERVAGEVHDRIQIFEYGLRGGRGVFVTQPYLDVDGWRAYIGSRDINREFFGALGFGYVVRVARADVPELERHMAAEYGDAVEIHTKGLPAPMAHDELFVIREIEPMDMNRQALGLDIGAEPRRRAAAERAMRTGLASLTAPVDLVQVGSVHRGFLYLLPVYRRGAPTSTEAEREQNLTGWVYAPIVLDRAMAGIDEFAENLVDVELFDGVMSIQNLLYDCDGHLVDHPTLNADTYAQRNFQVTHELAMGGRTWMVHVTSKPAFEALHRHDDAQVWIPGIALSTAMAAVFLSLAISRYRARALAEKMTSELVMRNQELEVSRQRLDEAAKAKGRFLANMSHELRTPMTAILGFSQYLADEAVSQHERAAYAGSIQRNGDHMLALINEVLDSAKIEAGMMRVEEIDTSLAEIVLDVHTVLRSRAVERGLEMNVQWCPRIPDPVRTDPTRVRQVLMNLAGNAIKFTEHGGIRLEVDVESRPSGDRLLVRVVDTGKGMSPDQLENLFQPFMQADDSISRQHGGTGLGLSISKQLAQLLGGDLYAQCTLGKGCCFVFELPLRASPTTRWLEPSECSKRGATTRKATPRLSGRILLVEDGPDNRKLISLLLRRAGAVVETAENGRQGVEAVLQAAAAGQPFQLVLMDVQMPVLDGLSATQQLRAAGITTPILALTANVLPEDRAKALDAGVDATLLKPIEHDHFFGTCREWLAKAHAPASAPI